MICLRVSFLALCALFFMVSALPLPDSGDQVPLPGPGLSYGGIPYGSVSGNVAEYFKNYAPSSGRSVKFVSDHHGNRVDFAPIEQYLR